MVCYDKLVKSNRYTSRKIVDILLKFPNIIYNSSPLDIPQSIFKYRKFDDHWKESVDGITFFSKAAEFNKNDNNDSNFLVNKDYLRDLVYNQLTEQHLNDNFNGSFIKEECSKLVEEHVSKIRGNFRIGCFTTVNPLEEYMWNNKDFGDEHRGFCIEYKVIPEILFPDPIIFLPVLYQDEPYDSTPIVKEIIENKSSLYNNIIPTAYNFILIKNTRYSKEKEWRIIVTKNRYNKYFDINDCKKNFSKLIKAIYLGYDYKLADQTDEKEKYILSICKKQQIPLYKMRKENFYPQIIYKP